ncbi:Uncharacterised protein [Mycobacterium tuberculosis]|nr:Uncharacterised protein [Mycobacterium tuberculosis]
MPERVWLQRMGRWRSARQARQEERPRVRPLAAGMWMLIAAASASAAIWLTTVWLLHVVDSAPATERAKIRVDAVRTGLAAGAGVGAAVGLMLAFRRQQHQEIATALADYDAAERRITELYNAAAEQLGSDKAPVRLTALYTLERLANYNPAHRQTIVNIICAYLRMPFAATFPGWIVSDEELAELPPGERATVAAVVAEEAATWRQERDVRLTAQRLLHTQLLRSASDGPRGELNVDLRGAVLIDLVLSGCSVFGATFKKAFFINFVNFHGTAITHASFDEASFGGFANFRETLFSEVAVFRKAFFAQDASFAGATFADIAYFGGTSSVGGFRFEEAIFSNTQNVETPPGWRVETAGDGAGRLVRDASGEGNQAEEG